MGIKSVFESINSIRHNDIVRKATPFRFETKGTGTTETSVQVETTPHEHYEYELMILCKLHRNCNLHFSFLYFCSEAAIAKQR